MFSLRAYPEKVLQSTDLQQMLEAQSTNLFLIADTPWQVNIFYHIIMLLRFLTDFLVFVTQHKVEHVVNGDLSIESGLREWTLSSEKPIKTSFAAMVIEYLSNVMSVNGHTIFM